MPSEGPRHRGETALPQQRRAPGGPAGAGPGTVGLAETRERVRVGIDPLANREADAVSAAVEAAAIRGKTSREVAELFLALHEAGWRNPNHRRQLRNTLDAYAHPRTGAVPVAEVGTAHVMAALEPIWTVKPETASQVRGWVERGDLLAKRRLIMAAWAAYCTEPTAACDGAARVVAA